MRTRSARRPTGSWLRPGFSAADLAEILAYGARGVNQALPPAPVETFATRYRQMCEAVLFGAGIQVSKARPRSRSTVKSGQDDGTAKEVPSV